VNNNWLIYDHLDIFNFTLSISRTILDNIYLFRIYIDKMGESISSLNLNLSQAMTTLTSNTKTIN